MKKLLLVLSLVAIVAIVASCKKDDPKLGPEPDPAQGTPVVFEVYSLDGENAEWTDYMHDNDISGDVVFVIDSNEELENHITGDYPQIDFDRKTLLLAAGWAGEVEPGDPKLYKFSDHYEMAVDLVVLSLTDYEFEWKFAILVDKLPVDSRVELDVTKSAVKTRSVIPSEYSGIMERKYFLMRRALRWCQIGWSVIKT